MRALWPLGITVESTGVQLARSAGAAATSISSAVATAMRPGRAMTPCASRYQPPAPRLRAGTTSLVPQMANRAGVMISDAAAATSATTAPAIPIDCRKLSGNRTRVSSDTATVTAL